MSSATARRTEELLSHWRQGAELFNERKYWHAHEAWERGWKDLPPPQLLRVQAMIQIAAVFHLLGLGRWEAAISLTRSVLEKLERVESHRWGTEARIEIPGSERALRALLPVLEARGDWRKIESLLHAEVQFGGDSSPASC